MNNNKKYDALVEQFGEDMAKIMLSLDEKKQEKFDDDEITLRDTKDDFQNFRDVLDTVGMRWDSYTTVEKRAIANAFAGVRQ